MSYSFQITASTREKARAMVASKLDELAVQQPVHRNDRDQALAAAEAYIGICEEPTAQQEMTVAMQGTVTWSGTETGQQVMGAGVSIAVGTRAKRAVDIDVEIEMEPSK